MLPYIISRCNVLPIIMYVRKCDKFYVMYDTIIHTPVYIELILITTAIHTLHTTERK